MRSINKIGKGGKVMKNKMAFLVSLIVVLLFSANASAVPIGFSGEFAPSEWETILNNSDGFVDTSGAPDSISIVSGNNGSYSEGYTDFAIIFPYEAIVSFDWDYTTNDQDGPLWDPFGFFLEDNLTQLTDDNGGASQLGSVTVKVSAQQVFGFQARTIDNLYGAAKTIISNFDVTDIANAPIPEPGTMILLSAGLIGAAGLMRRGKKGNNNAM